MSFVFRAAVAATAVVVLLFSLYRSDNNHHGQPRTEEAAG